MARETENRHRLIRLGHLPPPEESRRPRPFPEVVAEYVAWGRSEGGLRGRPWAKAHAQKVRQHLAFWERELDLRDIYDLEQCLPRVEKALRALQAEGRSGKTLKHYGDTLRALCAWCVDREYLAHHPLAKLKRHDDRPKTTRRAMTREEIRRLLATASPDRRVLYQVALGSGLRAGELRALQPRHLSADRCEIDIEAEWDKGRRDWNHPVAGWLAARLAQAGTGKPTNASLLDMLARPTAHLYADLNAAGVPLKTDQGYLDFHALRTTYITLVTECGANSKEVQVLARHSPSDLTHRVYIRARDERLHELAEAVGAIINLDQNYDPGMARPQEPDRPQRPNELPGQHLGSSGMLTGARAACPAHVTKPLRALTTAPAMAILLLTESWRDRRTT